MPSGWNGQASAVFKPAHAIGRPKRKRPQPTTTSTTAIANEIRPAVLRFKVASVAYALPSLDNIVPLPVTSAAWFGSVLVRWGVSLRARRSPVFAAGRGLPALPDF